MAFKVRAIRPTIIGKGTALRYVRTGEVLTIDEADLGPCFVIVPYSTRDGSARATRRDRLRAGLLRQEADQLDPLPRVDNGSRPIALSELEQGGVI